MHHPLDFSPITEFVILFSLIAPFWYTLLAWPLVQNRPSARAIGMAALVLGWTALMYGVVACNLDRDILGSFPGRPFVYFSIPVLLVLVLRQWLLAVPISQHFLVSLQIFRIIGMVFVLEWSRGVLPGIFAHPAGWGDLLTGCLAIGILIRWWRQPIPRQALVLLAVVGILDFISAFTFGFLSSASPVQQFSFDLPNRVTEYPTGLIPMFLVPFATIAHILSLSQLPPPESPERRVD